MTDKTWLQFISLLLSSDQGCVETQCFQTLFFLYLRGDFSNVSQATHTLPVIILKK